MFQALSFNECTLVGVIVDIGPWAVTNIISSNGVVLRSSPYYYS